MKKIAITGGLSSGKTSVCKIFEEKGAYVVSADDIVHELLSPQSSIGHQIVELLGKEVVIDSQFDRQKIAKSVFENKQILKSLENILHPAVLEEIEERFKKAKNQQKFAIFVAEIPLLYEIEGHHLFDTTVVVTADRATAQKRFQKKTNHPTEEFEKRMTHQLPLEEKSAKADHIITNNGSYAELEEQVATLYQKLTKQE